MKDFYHFGQKPKHFTTTHPCYFEESLLLSQFIVFIAITLYKIFIFTWSKSLFKITAVFFKSSKLEGNWIVSSSVSDGAFVARKKSHITAARKMQNTPNTRIIFFRLNNIELVCHCHRWRTSFARNVECRLLHSLMYCIHASKECNCINLFITLA